MTAGHAPDLASERMRLRMVAACVLLALCDADAAIRAQVGAGSTVDAAELAACIAATRGTLQLAEAALGQAGQRDDPSVPGGRSGT